MIDQHFKCWLWKILWSFSGLALVLAWFSVTSGSVAGLDTGIWFWSALITGVLSITIKLDCHTCSVCNARG